MRRETTQKEIESQRQTQGESQRKKDTHRWRVRTTQRYRVRETKAGRYVERNQDREDGSFSALPKHPALEALAWGGAFQAPVEEAGTFLRGLQQPSSPRGWVGLMCSL